ncbi:hypothetical protein ACQU6J_004571, partial [Escherichia coli]
LPVSTPRLLAVEKVVSYVTNTGLMATYGGQFTLTEKRVFLVILFNSLSESLVPRILKAVQSSAYRPSVTNAAMSCSL